MGGGGGGRRERERGEVGGGGLRTLFSVDALFPRIVSQGGPFHLLHRYAFVFFLKAKRGTGGHLAGSRR